MIIFFVPFVYNKETRSGLQGLKEALPTPFTSMYDVCLDADAREWIRWEDFMPPQVQLVDEISEMTGVNPTSARELNSSAMSTSNSVQTRDARIHVRCAAHVLTTVSPFVAEPFVLTTSQVSDEDRYCMHDQQLAYMHNLSMVDNDDVR